MAADKSGFSFPEDPLHCTIYNILASINALEDGFVSEAVFQRLSANLSDNELIETLAHGIPEIAGDIDVLKGLLSDRDRLELLTDRILLELDVMTLKEVSVRCVYRVFTKQIFPIQYLIAADIIENEMKERLNENLDELTASLSKEVGMNDVRCSATMLKALEAITRVQDHPIFGPIYDARVNELQSRFLDSVNSNLPAVVYESFGRAYMEALHASAPTLESLKVLEFDVHDFRHKLISDMKLNVARSTSLRLGIRRGPANPVRTSADWDVRALARFYCQYQSIPRIGDYPIWKHIFIRLEAAEFSLESVSEIVKELKDYNVPKELVEEARLKWKGLERPSQVRDDEFKVAAFGQRHALHLLGISTQSGFHTLRKRRYQGKKSFMSFSNRAKQEILASIITF